MFIYQDGKLYVRHDKVIKGVDINSLVVTEIEGTDTKLGDKYMVLTFREACAKFHIRIDNDYTFPREKSIEKVAEKPSKKAKKESKG